MDDQLKTLPLSPATEPNCPDFAELIKTTTPDRSLFEQIAECFAGRLEDFAKYYCRDDTLGKDALQDAMIATMRYLDTYRGDSPIEPWLRRIVMSACSRLRRGKKNDPALNLPFDEHRETTMAADGGPDQELRLMLLERLERMRQEIDRLKEPNRTLLLKHDLEETPLAELAAQFAMTEDAVKSRLKRSRATVREKLITKHPSADG